MAFRVGPSVSVVLPVYNRAHLVGRALESVLGQSHRDLEVIVVDDGSDDDLASSLGRFKDARLRLVSFLSNRGAAAARNAGIAKAQGQYIAFVDSDDWWLPRKLDRQLSFMRCSKTRWSCTASIVHNKYSPAGEIRGGNEFSIRSSRLASGCVWSPGSTLVAEKSLFEEVGPFDAQLSRLEDWDWMLRASKNSTLVVFEEPLSHIDYRHGETATYDAVVSSVRRMRGKHAEGLPFLSFRRLQFLAALERELAAAAYKNGRHKLAVCHFLKSLVYVPYLRAETIRRLANATLSDTIPAFTRVR